MKLFTMFILLILLQSVLQACVSGPPLDSKLKYLNGDSYESKAVIFGAPVLKTKKRKVKP